MNKVQMKQYRYSFKEHNNTFQSFSQQKLSHTVRPKPQSMLLVYLAYIFHIKVFIKLCKNYHKGTSATSTNFLFTALFLSDELKSDEQTRDFIVI